MAKKKRLIALAGCGPAVGLSFGTENDCERTKINAGHSYDLLRLNADRKAGGRPPTQDPKQIRQSANSYDAPHNLVMLFTAITSDNDVTLFKSKRTKSDHDTRRIENPTDASISRDRVLEKRDRGNACGGRATNCAANGVLSAYRNKTGDVTVAKHQAARNAAA